MKKKIYLLITAILLCCGIVGCGSSDISTKQCISEEMMYDFVADECLDFQKKVICNCTGVLKVDTDKLLQTVASKDQLLGNNIEMVKYSRTGSIITFEFKYLMNERQFNKALKMAERVAKKLDGLTEYEKVKTAHDYLVKICNYSYTNKGPYELFYIGHSNCTGYAMGFQMIMDVAGVDCRYIVNGTHAWNAVNVDGKWYNIDVTWDDNGTKELRYDYFLKCNNEFDRHITNFSCEQSISYDADLAYKNPIINLTHVNQIVIISIVILLCLILKFSKKKE